MIYNLYIMPYTDDYKINLIGGSYRITLPIEWVRRQGINKKDTLNMIVGDTIMVLPPKKLSDERIKRMFSDYEKLLEMIQSDE